MFTFNSYTHTKVVTIVAMVIAMSLFFWLSACSPVKNDTPQDSQLEQTENNATVINEEGTETGLPMISDVETPSDLQAIIIGEFSGKMNCTQCSYNKISLQLNTDGTAEKLLFHTSQQDTSTYQTLKGSYTQNKNIITIKFDDNPLDIQEEYYQLQDHYLIQLTNELRVPTDIILLQD